jgi:hypothetical protein
MSESVKAPCMPDGKGGCELCTSWPGYCPLDGKCECGATDQYVSHLEGFRCLECDKLLINFNHDDTIEADESEELANAKE